MQISVFFAFLREEGRLYLVIGTFCLTETRLVNELKPTVVQTSGERGRDGIIMPAH